MWRCRENDRNVVVLVVVYSFTIHEALFLLFLLGTLRADDGDGNENLTKAKRLITKTTILDVHHAFSYISLPSLHDYNVKMLNFTLYRGRTQTTTKFPPSLSTWIWFLGIQL